MKSNKIKNDSNCGCNRRQFLEVSGAAVAGMFATPLIDFLSSEFEPAKLSVKQGAVVKTIFFYPPSETFSNPPDGWWSWPGNTYDAEGHQNIYSEEIREDELKA